MSEPMRVALVAEGPTDYAILLAALDAILGETQPSFLQPPGDSIENTTPGGDAGTHGGGWKGVRHWCRTARTSGEWAAALERHAIIVVHVDADIAADPGLLDDGEVVDAVGLVDDVAPEDVADAAFEDPVEKPCPPAQDTVDALRPVVARWIGPPLEPACVLCVPSKASDVWLVVALDLSGDEPECDANPAVRLRAISERPRPVSGHKPDKHAAGYRRLASSIRDRWAHVMDVCRQAARFDTEVRMAAGERLGD